MVGGGTDVPAQLQGERQALANPALPVVSADYRIHVQAFDEDCIHATFSCGTTSSKRAVRLRGSLPRMDSMFWLLTLLAYLIGSLSFAILLSRLAGMPDPRAGGSGNPGATNMLRLAGKRLAICTLFGDLLKGLLPVLLAASLDISVQQQI